MDSVFFSSEALQSVTDILLQIAAHWMSVKPSPSVFSFKLRSSTYFSTGSGLTNLVSVTAQNALH